MAEEIIQQQNQLHDMSSVDALTEDQCLVNINRVKNLLPQSGFDGLGELLGLLEEMQVQWLQEGQADAAQSENRVLMLDEILVLAEQHLQQTPGDEIIDDLLFGVTGICTEVNLTEEDLAMLKQLLLQDGVEQTVTSVIAVSEQSNPNQHSAQLAIQDTNPDFTAPETEEVSRASANIPQHLKEFLGLLQLSVQQLESNLTEMLLLLSNGISSLEQIEASGEDFESELNKFTGVAEIAGFDGLRQSCEHMQDNYFALKNSNFKLLKADSQNWSDWIEAVVSYLQSPLDQDLIQQLLLVHCASGWLSALSEGKTAELLISLRELGSVNADNADSEQPQRQIEATDDDVSLQLPDDVFPELLESLLQELPVLTEQFSEAIQFLSHGGRMNDLTIAQRVAHTIKGAGNTVGIKGIANLTHHLEDILTALANAETLPGKIIINSLLRAADCLEEMSEALTSSGSAPSDAKQVLQEILDLASRIDREGVTIETEESSAQVKTTPAAVTDNDESKPEATEEPSEALIRVPISTVDKLMQYSNEVMIINGQLRERLRQTNDKTRMMQKQLDFIYELGLDLEELVDVRNYDLLKKTTSTNTTNDFDSLEMDQYNELHTCSRRIHEVTTDIREIGNTYRKELMEIDNMLVEQKQLLHLSQNDLLTMRLVPVQSILPRIQRSVRQACRLTGKNVDLQINGGDVQMDRDILNGIIDPLMHVLRNAVDHGIESDEKRIAVGKEAGGTIQLNFHKVDNLIEITCCDDGAGLNLDAIRAKGIDRGIIAADADISEDELKQLIFKPNFSTSENVTQVSGRGVGMDAVSSGIRALGGSLSLDSVFGEGCQLKISLPLSLVYYHSLLVKVGTQSVALAEYSIEQILHPGAGALDRHNDELSFVFEDQVYAVKTLDSLLSRVVPDNSIALEKRTVVLIQHEMTRYAILVESIVGVAELVVKDFGGFVPDIHGVIGASILDDGSIAPVLDLQELLKESSYWTQLDLDQIGIDQDHDQSYALVVDDSLSARRSLEQFVGDLGFSVMAARDGQEAIEMINNRIPDIVITDMEMPRVNGIELAEFIRAKSTTSQIHIPVIMITSRSTSKHRTLAQSKGVDVYLTKPYSEQELTDHVMELVNYTEHSKQAIAS